MKALTLWQPWASLIAEGRKISETRSWAPPESCVGTTIAIHAAIRKPQEKDLLHLQAADLDLPFGAVVCTARIEAVYRSGGVRMARFMPRPRDLQVVDSEGLFIQNEDAYGNYMPGRFVWLLGRVRRLDKPVPCSGRQRLWNLPRGVREQVLEGPGVLIAGT